VNKTESCKGNGDRSFVIMEEETCSSFPAPKGDGSSRPVVKSKIDGTEDVN
jgi:hypothetical protein